MKLPFTTWRSAATDEVIHLVPNSWVQLHLIWYNPPILTRTEREMLGEVVTVNSNSQGSIPLVHPFSFSITFSSPLVLTTWNFS